MSINKKIRREPVSTKLYFRNIKAETLENGETVIALPPTPQVDLSPIQEHLREMGILEDEQVDAITFRIMRMANMNELFRFML